MHEVLPGRRPLVRCRFSRYRCSLPGFEPSTLVECVVGPATSRCRLSCVPMKPSNDLGGSRGEVEGTLKRNVVGRHSQSVACGRRGCSPASGSISRRKELEPSSCQIRAITARQLVG
jgi:hypothetical protein